MTQSFADESESESESSVPLTQLLMAINANMSEPDLCSEPPDCFQCHCITDDHQPATVCIEHYLISSDDERHLRDIPEWQPRSHPVTCSTWLPLPQSLHSVLPSSENNGTSSSNQRVASSADAFEQCPARLVESRSVAVGSSDLQQSACRVSVNVTDAAVVVGESLLAASNPTGISPPSRAAAAAAAASVSSADALIPCNVPPQTVSASIGSEHAVTTDELCCSSPGPEPSPVIVVAPDHESTSPGYLLSCDEHSSYEQNAELCGPLDNLAQPEVSPCAEPVVSAEHSHTRLSVMSEDVIEDLFRTTLITKNPGIRSSDCYYQSTQISRTDIPDGTVVIQPDFPLSPLQCSISPCQYVHSDTMVTRSQCESVPRGSHPVVVTATCCSPTAAISCHSLASQLADATFPSAVISRARDLFCMTDSDKNASSWVSDGETSEDRHENRCDNEAAIGAGNILCSVAVSCNCDFSPILSSYVDAGGIVQDVRTSSERSFLTTSQALVVCTNTVSSVDGICITDVRSAQYNSESFLPSTPDITQNVLSSDHVAVTSKTLLHSSKTNVQGGLNMCSPFTKEAGNRCKSDGSDCGKKRSSPRKQNSRKSDVLFRQAKDLKPVTKKRKLYKHDMLMEEDEEFNDFVTGSFASVDKHSHSVQPVVKGGAPSNCETAVSSHDLLASAVVHSVVSDPAALLPTCNVSRTALNTAGGEQIDVSISCQRLSDVTGVEFYSRPLAANVIADVDTHHGTSVGSPANMTRVEPEMPQCDQVVISQTHHDQSIDTAPVCSSLLLPSDGINASISVSYPSIQLSDCMHDSLLANDAMPVDHRIDKSDVECNTGVAVAGSSNVVVCGDKLSLSVVQRCRTDSSTDTHKIVSVTASLVSADVSSDTQSRIKTSGSELVHTSPNKAVVCGESSDSRIDCVALSTDSNEHAGPSTPHRSRSLNEVVSQSNNFTNLKSVSFENTLELCSDSMNETEVTQDVDSEWYSQNRRRNLSRKKTGQYTAVSCEAPRNVSGNTDNIGVSADVCDLRGKEARASATELYVASQSTSETSSINLPCAQRSRRRSSFQNLTVSQCRLAASGAAFLPNHSCSLQCKERHCIPEETSGQPVAEHDSVAVIAAGREGRMSVHNKPVSKSSASDKELSNEMLSVSSDVIKVNVRADTAATAETSCDSKQSSSVSVTGKLTLPTPKNSLTSYQQLAHYLPPDGILNEPSSSRSQLNYNVIQELLGLTTLSDSQKKVYTYQLPADVEVSAFNHFKLHST